MELQQNPNNRPRFVFPKQIDLNIVPDVEWNTDQLLAFAKSNTKNETLLGKIPSDKSEEICRWRQTLYLVKWNNIIWLCDKGGHIVYILNNYWNQRKNNSFLI